MAGVDGQVVAEQVVGVAVDPALGLLHLHAVFRAVPRVPPVLQGEESGHGCRAAMQLHAQVLLLVRSGRRCCVCDF